MRKVDNKRQARSKKEAVAEMALQPDHLETVYSIRQVHCRAGEAFSIALRALARYFCTQNQNLDGNMLTEALRVMRVFHDFSQKELAEKLGISKSHLSEIESGKKNPTLPLLERYAEVFDVPVSSIMFFSENMDKGDFSEKTRVFVSSKILSILKFIAERSGQSHAE